MERFSGLFPLESTPLLIFSEESLVQDLLAYGMWRVAMMAKGLQWCFPAFGALFWEGPILPPVHLWVSTGVPAPSQGIGTHMIASSISRGSALHHSTRPVWGFKPSIWLLKEHRLPLHQGWPPFKPVTPPPSLPAPPFPDPGSVSS